ncbi:hypothetical protein BDZ88DRAFT_448951 [Geranomyces variabilis]|nr:hypothetical protein BDZ88DRAFT_448951 [Geranomyces variabilis]KAJ3139638.1 hypothetical protein HDU90_009139 [Geranomyces variabilis]
MPSPLALSPGQCEVIDLTSEDDGDGNDDELQLSGSVKNLRLTNSVSLDDSDFYVDTRPSLTASPDEGLNTQSDKGRNTILFDAALHHVAPPDEGPNIQRDDGRETIIFSAALHPEDLHRISAGRPPVRSASHAAALAELREAGAARIAKRPTASGRREVEKTVNTRLAKAELDPGFAQRLLRKALHKRWKQEQGHCGVVNPNVRAAVTTETAQVAIDLTGPPAMQVPHSSAHEPAVNCAGAQPRLRASRGLSAFLSPRRTRWDHYGDLTSTTTRSASSAGGSCAFGASAFIPPPPISCWPFAGSPDTWPQPDSDFDPLGDEPYYAARRGPRMYANPGPI